MKRNCHKLRCLPCGTEDNHERNSSGQPVSGLRTPDYKAKPSARLTILFHPTTRLGVGPWDISNHFLMIKGYEFMFTRATSSRLQRMATRCEVPNLIRSRWGYVYKLEGGSYGGHRCAATSPAHSDGSIRRPGTAHTSREGDNSAAGEGATEYTKRSKFIMAGTAAASGRLCRQDQDPASSGVMGDVEYVSCGHKTLPPASSGFHVSCSKAIRGKRCNIPTFEDGTPANVTTAWHLIVSWSPANGSVGICRTY